MSKKKRPDMTVRNEGNIFLLTPLTKTGRIWCDKHLDPDCHQFGPSIVVEHRYIFDVVKGMISDGLGVA